MDHCEHSLAYFLSQFIALFLNLLVPLHRSDPILFSVVFTLVYTLSKPIAGTLFDVALWTTAKNIRHNNVLRNHMVISAYGFVLLFTSNQVLSYQELVFTPNPLSYWFGLITNSAHGFVLLFLSNQTLVFVPYPPFGLAATFFVGLSSYLILLGIYYSAISVAQDIKLRQSARKFAMKESKLLDSIGTAEMEQEIHRRVTAILGEEADYDKVIARYRTEGLGDSWSKDMKIIPVNFKEHKAMLGHCKMILEDDRRKIAINPRFDKLITALRTAVDNDGTLDKEATAYNDIFDAFRLALKFYHYRDASEYE